MKKSVIAIAIYSMLGVSNVYATGGHTPKPTPDPVPTPYNPSNNFNPTFNPSFNPTVTPKINTDIDVNNSISNKLGQNQDQSQSQSNSQQQSSSQSSSQANKQASSQAMTGGNTDYRMYAFPVPVQAAPLPASFCPKGDSLSWSIGWNFISYAVSSTRTEAECLDKVLAYMRETAPKVIEQRLPALKEGENIHPVCNEVTVIERDKKNPKKVPPKITKIKPCN